MTLSVGAIALALSAASPVAAQRALTIGAQTPPSTLDPHFHNATSNSQTLRQIYEPLFEVDTEFRIQPRLAESIRLVDPLTWEVKLRAGVLFHDGTPFEPDDIAFTFQRIPNVPQGVTLFTPFVRPITSIEVVDATTVRLRTAEPHPMLPWDMTQPLIISRRVHGPEPSTSEFNNGRLAIGTGPYRLAGYVPRERFEIVRNDRYWGPPAAWDRVLYRYIPQAGSRLATLLAGEVDLIDNVPLQDVPRLESDPAINVFGVDGVGVAYLFPDGDRETIPFVADRQGRPLARNPFADPRVRQALSLAINRAVIAERLYYGQARPADQLPAPGAEHRLDTSGPLPFDPVRARALLAEAGWPDGFRLTIHGPSGNFPMDDSLLQAIAQGFTRIGIETQVEVLPPAVLLSRATRREFSLFMNYFSTNLSIHIMRQLAMTRDQAKGWGAFNRQRYSNPVVDQALLAAMGELDEDRRRAHTHRAIKALNDDMGVIPVVYLRNVWAGRADRVRYSASPLNWTSATFATPVN
ncbi:ABC transporter substrate-binding protein [Elioraea sp.]|uniref:ABC transporter substrate-binding protein n=1 Tax=Elioraea sp. TaxID=2185103 RepID=UPI003F70D366